MTFSHFDIPDLDRHIARSHSATRMAAASPRGGFAGRAFMNHTANHIERPAVRGFACKYHEVFERDGALYAFLPGAFSASLASGEEIKMQLQHQDVVFGSNRDGLSFVDSKESLAFQFEVPKNQSGSMLIAMVTSGDRTDMSVGCEMVEIVTRNIQGHDVRLITKATLREISVVRDGAVKQSHVRVVDLDEAIPLSDEIDSGLMKCMARLNESATSVRTTERAIAKLGDAIDARVTQARSAARAKEASDFFRTKHMRSLAV